MTAARTAESGTPGRLIVDLNRLNPEGEIFEGETSPDAIGLEESEFVRPAGGIAYKLTIQALGTELLVRGRLQQRFLCRCASCDKWFDLAVKEADFVNSFEIHEENAFPDLTEAIREAIILALPAYPRCSDACQGLCRSCGVDLNEGGCGCSAGRGDDCWSALDALNAPD
jgi:uncharacterized protein